MTVDEVHAAGALREHRAEGLHTAPELVGSLPTSCMSFFGPTRGRAPLGGPPEHPPAIEVSAFETRSPGPLHELPAKGGCYQVHLPRSASQWIVARAPSHHVRKRSAASAKLPRAPSP